MALGKALALSGPLEKITLKDPTCNMHELLRGLSVSSKAGMGLRGEMCPSVLEATYAHFLVSGPPPWK